MTSYIYVSTHITISLLSFSLIERYLITCPEYVQIYTATSPLYQLLWRLQSRGTHGGPQSPDAESSRSLVLPIRNNRPSRLDLKRERVS